MVALNLIILNTYFFFFSLNVLLHYNLFPLSSQYFLDMEVDSRQKKTRHSLPLTLFPLPARPSTLHSSTHYDSPSFGSLHLLVRNSFLPFQDCNPHLLLLSALLFFNYTYHNLTPVHVYCIAFSTRM